MSFLSQKVSRVLIHLLFWALFVFISLFVFSDYYWKENPFLQYFFILIAIVYVNNGILLPYFVKRKNYFIYAVIIGAIAFLATQLYCNYFAQCGCSIMKCLSDYLWQTLVPIVFFSFVWLLYRYLEKQEEIAVIRKEHLAMELQFLKSQINPHVLFNTLNTIYSCALEQPDKAPDMILMLSDNLKHVLYESNADKVPLAKELVFIDNYITFQKMRTENLKTIEYLKNIDNEQYQIAPLLLISLIENAFKHSANKSTIYVNITVENGVLYCKCKNKIASNRIPIETSKIGLDNLKKRLALIYKDTYELQIEIDDFYEVVLTLPLV